MKAGRVLDKLVAEKVMGWREVRLNSFPVPYYSVDIATAFTVVKKLYDGGWSVCLTTQNEQWAVRFSHPDLDEAEVEDSALPKAICLAALKAVRIRRRRGP